MTTQHTPFLRSLSHFLLGLIGFVLVSIASAGRLCAQTSLNSTTLSTIMNDSSSRNLIVASTTGITAVGTGANAVYLVVDREIMGPVNSVNTTTGAVTVATRGSNGSRATPHVSGATVYVAPPPAVLNYIPTGGCNRANLAYVPIVVGGTQGLGGDVGTLYDCLGSSGTTNTGQYVQTNGTGAVVIKGGVVASTATIAITGNYFQVSGTNTIATITVPAGWGLGQCVALEPTGIFLTTTTGNISIGSTAVVGKMMFMCWSGSKWNPSY